MKRKGKVVGQGGGKEARGPSASSKNMHSEVTENVHPEVRITTFMQTRVFRGMSFSLSQRNWPPSHE